MGEQHLHTLPAGVVLCHHECCCRREDIARGGLGKGGRREGERRHRERRREGERTEGTERQGRGRKEVLLNSLCFGLEKTIDMYSVHVIATTHQLPSRKKNTTCTCRGSCTVHVHVHAHHNMCTVYTYCIYTYVTLGLTRSITIVQYISCSALKIIHV